MIIDNSKTIVNLSNSILKHFGVEPFHNTISEIDELLKGHKKVVVMLFDGFGEAIQDKNSDCCKNIIANRYTSIRATFPPTTVASTTGFLTGKFPIETGWMSWVQYIPSLDKNIEVFRNRDSLTKELLQSRDDLILTKYCPTTSIIEQINKINGKTIAYDMKYFKGTYKGPKYLTIARWKLNKLIRKQEDEFFMYYYFESPDHEMHEFGTTSKAARSRMKRIEHFTKKIVKKNKDTLFLLISDHGQIDCDYFDLHDYPDFTSLLVEENPLSFEKRSQTFFVKESKNKEFEELFNKYFGEHFELFTKEEVLEKKLYGEGEAHPMVDIFLGDYLAVSKDTYCFLDHRVENPFLLKGSHAGGTEDEMKIAVSAFNK